MPEITPQAHHEIKILEERLAKLREVVGKPETGPAVAEKELLREAVADRIRRAMPLPPAPVPVIAPAIQPRTEAHDEAKEIEPFITMAFSQDIPTAVKAVMKSGNAHLIDALHDALVDRFYEELVKLGKLK